MLKYVAHLENELKYEHDLNDSTILHAEFMHQENEELQSKLNSKQKMYDQDDSTLDVGDV